MGKKVEVQIEKHMQKGSGMNRESWRRGWGRETGKEMMPN